jgi:hypothetical protein
LVGDELEPLLVPGKLQDDSTTSSRKGSMATTMLNLNGGRILPVL